MTSRSSSSLYFKVINRVWPATARQIKADDDNFDYRTFIALINNRAATFNGGLYEASPVIVPFKHLAYHYNEGFIVAWNTAGKPEDLSTILLYILPHSGQVGIIKHRTIKTKGIVIQAAISAGKVVYCCRMPESDEYE